MNAATVFMLGLLAESRNDEWDTNLSFRLSHAIPNSALRAGENQRDLHALAATTPPTAARRDVRSRTSHAVSCSSSPVPPGLLSPDIERRMNEAENDREPDQPHGHLVVDGWRGV